MMETEIAGSSSLEESLSVNPSPTTASNTFSAVCLYVVIAEHCRRLQTPFCAEDGMAYYGTYRGNVVNTADPSMKGRLQVNVPAVAGAATWALPCRDYG